MKIKVRHLGRIKQATLELRPITLIVGENNTNKSWTAYSAYTLLRSLQTYQPRLQIRPRIITRRLTEQIRKLASEAALRISKVPSTASVYLEFSRKSITEFVGNELRIGVGSRQLADVLAAPKEVLSNASASLSIPRSELENGAEFFFISLGSDGALYYGLADKPPTTDFTFNRDNFGRFFSELGGRSITTEFVFTERMSWEQRIEGLLLDFTLGILRSVWALPAERKALVTLYKGLTDDTRNQLPLPLRHFITNLRNAENWAKDLGNQTDNLKANSRIYSKLEQILGGHIEFESASVGQRLVFSPAKNLALPMQAASSMVRSLSGFALAIQQFLGSGNILVIDEPEMNAHPSAQLGIVEILGALANLGNYVIATTHSPYVIDHFNNLIAAGEIQEKFRRRAVEKFILKMEESFLTSKQVSAYELSPEGKVRDLVDPDRGRIATTTFGNVSNRLENLYSDLIEMKHA